MNALEIKNLTVSFLMYDKGIKKKALQVISDLNITLKAGEIHAIAGSSGSGKSLLAHALLGILPKNAVVGGEMSWFGEPLTPALQKKLRGNQLVLVPQSVNYLDPLMRVGKQISKAIFTTAILCGILWFLDYCELVVILITPAALLTYIPLALAMLILWFLIGHLL